MSWQVVPGSAVRQGGVQGRGLRFPTALGWFWLCQGAKELQHHKSKINKYNNFI